MATPDELRATLAEARAVFREAIEEAEMGWRRGPGDGAWTAQEVAEHVIQIEARITTMICEACGYPGVEVGEPDCASSIEAVDEFDAVVNRCDAKLQYVTPEDLEKPHENFGNVAGIFDLNVAHLVEHTGQILEAAAS